MQALDSLSLDHLVVTTRFDLARAAEIFDRLGFTLTPQGYHAMGSVNHLMLFDDCYLEIIGVPEHAEVQRKEVLDAPKGIDSLVWKTGDADGVHAALTRAGLPVQPLHAFSRTIERDGRPQEAGFRTVRALPGTFAAGRVYYCQHLTPELIWLPEYQTHRNGVHRQTGLTLVADDPAKVAAQYAPWADSPVQTAADGGISIRAGSFVLDVVSPAAYAAQYGDLCCDALGRSSFFGAIHLVTSDVGAMTRVLQAPGPTPFRTRALDGRIAVAIDEFNTLLVFSS